MWCPDTVPMDSAQRGVAVGMATALATTAVVFVVAVAFGGARIGEGASVDVRAALLAASVMAPAIALFVCIARLARHRFFNAEDINGSGLTEGSARARLLQALLQNTLEQSALAVPVYVSCAIIFPGRFLAAIPAAAALFLVGRIFFYAGYSKGAAARAFGFALTFYPTAFLGCAALLFLAMRDVA